MIYVSCLSFHTACALLHWICWSKPNKLVICLLVQEVRPRVKGMKIEHTWLNCFICLQSDCLNTHMSTVRPSVLLLYWHSLCLVCNLPINFRFSEMLLCGKIELFKPLFQCIHFEKRKKLLTLITNGKTNYPLIAMALT